MLFTNLSFYDSIGATLVNATFDLPAMRDADSSMSGFVGAPIMLTKLHRCITSVRIQEELVGLGLVGLWAQDAGDGRQQREGFDVVVVVVAAATASVTAVVRDDAPQPSAATTGQAPPGRRRRQGSFHLTGRRGGGIGRRRR
jgi:hypothetical protein